MKNPATRDIKSLKSGTHLKDYFALLVRRKWIIAVAFLSVVLSAAYYVSKIEDIFQSSATLVIEENNTLINQAMNLGSGRSLSFYQGILNSRTYLEMVLDSIGFDVFESVFESISRDDALGYIQNNISLKKTSYTSFYSFTARAKSKELAYLIASIGTDIFRHQCMEVATEEARRTVVEIDKQLEIVKKNLEKAEHEYRSFKERTGDILEGATPELRTLQNAYADNLAQLGLKEADLNAEKKQLRRLESKLAPKESKRSPEYLKLRSKLSELEKEKMRLENLGIRLSGMSTIDREIQEVENQLIQYRKEPGTVTVNARMIRQWQELRKSVLNKEAELELFKRKLESYKNAIENYKKGNPDILNQSLELQRLRLTKENYERIYNFLIKKAEEERLKSASGTAGIKIVDAPRMPSRPIPKNEKRYYALGIIFGLALGLGLAFFVEYNDTTIKSNDDVERYLGVSVLGTIPHISYSKKNEIEIKRRSSKKQKRRTITQYPKQLLNFSGDESIITEAYRSLRTNLSFVSPDNPIHTILLTSAGPSEGKSLTITNLAMANAQLGRKTLLIDTDLRRPILHHLFNFKREPGFTELFAEHYDYNSVIRSTDKENLFVLTAGLFSPNPAELIGSQRMMQHINYFKENFDIVFFDTPPVVAVTDASLLSTKIDAVLLVVKSHHTDREIASRAVQNLRNVGAKIVGTVLNDIDLTHRYSSYGYYKYYYHYYKSKTD
ncbi:MAG: polysaccharide biosynthesis tyrosine autokinase [Chitinivibrionales bacterium]|nr:polysaccharide biosynthesis tyrosine autokinase [Chitinivibrionales bacterium]